MDTQYDPSAVEPKWQKKWAEVKAFEVDLTDAKDKYLSMVMFPYPSGDRLHVGHWYAYAPADSYSRFMRMQGKRVFTPIGFDAFGLPAENYAIKTGIHPDQSITENTATMTDQLKRIGTMYDWGKAVNTSKPEYYKWTQWLFLQMFKNGLAYRQEANVNFCESCQTVLANEQAQDGNCERCGNEVLQRPLTQWFWKITNYSQQLLDGLEEVDWPEKTRLMQQNWIGRKQGINITYEIEGTNEVVTCFTTRPDTNFGATFIVLAPEHPLITKIINGELPSENRGDVEVYVKAAAKKTEIERQAEGTKKTGVFTGYTAINNLNGAKLPIWVSDFVLAGFGTGAVVGVPGHDKRDFEFATTFDIPVKRVVVASDGDTSEITSIEQVQEEEGTMVNSEFLDGMDIMAAIEAMMDHLEKNKWGKRVVTYRLRDWLISRQRYWGAPIPIYYDAKGEPQPIPEEHLPWELPTDVEFKPTGTSPLADSKELQARVEEKFGKGCTPEYDTMDTFVCSSFYQYRYLAGGNEGDQKELVSKKAEKDWMPVDMYIGGPEHACMHLIYARFVTKALKDFGFVNHNEPYKRLVHQGLITKDGAKMSKSKGNVVSPDEFVDKYGSDCLRMYLMFMGPFTEGGDWSDTGIKGVARFMQKIWRNLIEDRGQRAEDSGAVISKLHATIKKVGEDIERLHFNTALAALMELMNLIEKEGSVSTETAKTITVLLGPMAPHLAEELWEALGGKGLVIDQTWPSFDEAKLITDTITVAVQVNGKVRSELTVAADITEKEVIELAKADKIVAKYLEGGTKKEIYVPGKLVSLVV